MTYDVFRTKEYEKAFSKLPKSEKEQISKTECELSSNPFAGKAPRV